MSCNRWPEEAALRLLMNHLGTPSTVDAIVAAHPVFLTHAWAPRVRAAKPDALEAAWPSGVDMSLGATDMNATYRAGGQAQ
jgi:hypothetical protein